MYNRDSVIACFMKYQVDLIKSFHIRSVVHVLFTIMCEKELPLGHSWHHGMWMGVRRCNL